MDYLNKIHVINMKVLKKVFKAYVALTAILHRFCTETFNEYYDIKINLDIDKFNLCINFIDRG